jgi:hypothetical protein
MAKILMVDRSLGFESNEENNQNTHKEWIKHRPSLGFDSKG